MYIPKEYIFYIKQNAYIDGKAAAKIFRFAINFKNSKIVQNCKKTKDTCNVWMFKFKVFKKKKKINYAY